MKNIVSILAFALTLSVYAPSAYAQWSRDSTVNIPLSDTGGTSDALAPRAVTDGKGGAIVAWYHGGLGVINGQRVDATGKTVWKQNGNDVGSMRQPGFAAALRNSVIIPDGSGGAIIAWNESSQRSIGASRVKPDGTLAWDKLICYTTGLRVNPALSSDGAGGAIIAWQDSRNDATSSIDIYAQRVSATGEAMWDSNGVAICTAAYEQTVPSIASDGIGGAFIAWQDHRTTTNAIYARRINSSGQVLGRANGIPLNAGGNFPALSPKIAATEIGEAVIVWEDASGEGGSRTDIYAQKISLDTVVWAARGVSVCNAPFNQNEPAIVADGAGGAIITWSDTRTSTSNPDIYAQSVSSSGLGQWIFNGVPICTVPDRQVAPAIASDGQGGAVIAWEDYRSGTNYDIYAQRVNGGGGTLWTSNGRPVCVEPHDQRSAGITGDGSGGAIIAWSDYRNNSWFVIYAQGVRANGSLGGTTAVEEETAPGTFRLEQNYPNPFNPTTEIKYQLSEIGHVTLKVFDLLGREVATLVNEHLTAGSYSVAFNAEGLSRGVYWYRLTTGGRSLTKKILAR